MSNNGPKAFDMLIERYEKLSGAYPCFKVEILKLMKERSIEPSYWERFAHSVYFAMKWAKEKDEMEDAEFIRAMNIGSD